MKIKRDIPKVYKTSFGSYYVLTNEMFSQADLAEAYTKQNSDAITPAQSGKGVKNNAISKNSSR